MDESRIQQCKLHIVFTGIKHFNGGIILKPMLMYDQGIENIQKNGETQVVCFNHAYGSLN